MRVEWTRRALRSLDTIGDYIAKDNPKRAITFTHELFHQADRLEHFPQMGRPSARAHVREFVIHKNYVVSYRLKLDKVEILVSGTVLNTGCRDFCHLRTGGIGMTPGNT